MLAHDQARAERASGNPLTTSFLAARRRQCVLAIIALLAVALLAGAVQTFHVLWSPDTAFFTTVHGAKWIVDPRPAELRGQWLKSQTTTFRRTIALTQVPAKAALVIRGYRLTSASLDGKSLSEATDPAAWKQWREVDLAPYLHPGEQTLIISVRNDRGPPALQARCAELGLVTDERWEADSGSNGWAAAHPADVPRHADLSDAYPRAGASLLATCPVWLTVM